MSHFYPLTDTAGGGLERQRCAADLDQVLLNRDPQKIAAFLDRWGEPLRELIHDFDRLADQLASPQSGEGE